MNIDDQILQWVRDGKLSVEEALSLLFRNSDSDAAQAYSNGAHNGNGNGALHPPEPNVKKEPTAKAQPEAGSGQAMVQEKLQRICEKILKKTSLNPQTNFFELGMDSFGILGFLHQIHEAFGIQINPTFISSYPTIAQLARHIAGEIKVTPPSKSSPAPTPACGLQAASEAISSSAAMPSPTNPTPQGDPDCDMDFGLYFFANYDHSVDHGKYRLLIDAVKFADQNGFSSVFSPERHFEDFGGLFPNSAVVNAALAMVTRQIHIRAGSVVSPLHDPLRIAEDWAVVDNLSDGRAGVSFTYGWQCDDFVFYPDRYLSRHAHMFEQIETVRRLWRGGSVRRTNGLGKEIEVRTFPRPIQKEIPIWVTCAISCDSFVNAGRVGANVVTFLLGQGLGDLKEKIAAYRQALADSGFDPEKGRVSLMVHTFLGEDLEEVKRKIRAPFLRFIRAQAQLARNLVRSVDPTKDIDDPKTMDALMDIGFERFFGNSGLMGTVDSCRESVRRFKELGVDELSCLIDFGVDYESVMESMKLLCRLKDHFVPSRKARNLFPDQAGRGGIMPVCLPANNAAAPGLSSQGLSLTAATSTEHRSTENGGVMDRLEAFRSYLPGGSRVPGAPKKNGNTDFIKRQQAGAHSSSGQSANGLYPELRSEPRALHEPFPLTAVQKAYWMGRNPRFELGSTSTHGYVELNVQLDLQCFQRAIQQVVDRHPMLRAVIISGREQKVLAGPLEYQMEVLDLSGLSPAEQRQRILDERERQSHRIFDPSTWPLFDFKAFVLGTDRQYLSFGFDSLIADAASLTLIFREIMELYRDPGKKLPELHFTFRDYMRGYEAFRESEVFRKDREYWMEKIPALPAAPQLPLVKEPAAVRQSRFLRHAATIEKKTWEKLKEKAQAQLITPTVLLFAAFAEVLARWSREPRFTLNLTVFNRFPFHPDVNHIVGDFTSLMLVGVDFRAERTFWQNAATIQATVLESLQHRHFDGVEVIKELARQRDLLGRAVIPVVFTSNLLNTQNGSDGLSEMGEIAYMITQTTQAYLDNQVAESKDGLYIAWDYVAELFDPSVIGKMFQDYIAVIEGLVGIQRVPSDAPSLTSLEWFVEHYNGSDDSSIVPTTLAELFRAQVERTPENEAVRFGAESLTYRELDRQSNQVAHYLMRHGVGRGDLVGVMTPRGIPTIVNTLGIVKSGAAYVPVDPEYPEARRKYILEKSGSKVVLTPELLAQIRRDCPAAPVSCPSRKEDLAYIIFTSGSTGLPKGVMITHAAVTNTLIDMNRRFAVNGRDRVLGISSMCFDLSVYDVFGTLSAGACLVLIDDIRNPRNLVRTVCEQKITIWNSVPTLFRMLVEAFQESDHAPELRLAMMSGDWIPITLPDAARKRFPRTELMSLGGATEASIWSIYYPIGQVAKEWKSIPYGYPMANQKFYVLNEKMEFCAIDVPGELYIGGVGLSTGYFNDREKTERAFIVHPRLGNLYRTGDWGAWRSAGYIEFLGRRDHQVKIRGFRVELGEIENQLMKHPGVKQAIVLDKTDEKGSRYLCAYIVPKNGKAN